MNMMKMVKLMKMKMKMMKIKMKMMKMKMKMMKMKMLKMKVKMSMMMMKKVSDDDGYFVMKVILWWNLSKDESYLVMKVMIVKEVMKGNVSPVAMFSYKVLHQHLNAIQLFACFRQILVLNLEAKDQWMRIFSGWTKTSTTILKPSDSCFVCDDGLL